MTGYGQYCPLARGAEIFAERWTPLIVRNLSIGCHTFGQIADGMPGVSRTILSQRLRQLERYGVIERRPAKRGSTYHLTPSGQELVEVCIALGTWGARWLEVAPEHLDAHVVLWAIGRLMDKEELPKPQVVARFDLTDDVTPNRMWLVVSNEDSEVCVTPPGYADDLVVTTSTVWLTKWHMGWISLAAAERAGHIRIEGQPPMRRAFRRWGGLSIFADVRTVVDQPLAAAADRPR